MHHARSTAACLAGCGRVGGVDGDGLGGDGLAWQEGDGWAGRLKIGDGRGRPRGGHGQRRDGRKRGTERLPNPAQVGQDAHEKHQADQHAGRQGQNP